MSTVPGMHETDGISAKMVDSIGDDDIDPSRAQPSQAFAAPDAGPYRVPEDMKAHDPNGPCASCKKELGAMRAALIVLAIVIGALAMIYLAQRRGHSHGDGNQDASAPITND